MLLNKHHCFYAFKIQPIGQFIMAPIKYWFCLSDRVRYFGFKISYVLAKLLKSSYLEALSLTHIWANWANWIMRRYDHGASLSKSVTDDKTLMVTTHSARTKSTLCLA